MSELESLFKDLDSDDVAVRRSAVFKLGETKNPDAMEGLVKALHDQDDTIRANAARGLGKINNENAVDSLIEALDDSNIRVKQNAAWALGKFKAKGAVKKLIQLVNPEYAIFTTHGDVGGGDIIQNDEMKQQGVPNPDVIIKSIEALGEIGDPRALDVIYYALTMDDLDTVKSAACLAVGKIGGGEESAKKLIRPLNDPLWYIRRDAAIGLGKLQEECAVPDLVKKLNDAYEEVKINVLKALMSIGGSANIYLFKMFVKDPQNQPLKEHVAKIPKPELKKILKEIIKTETNENAKVAYEAFLKKLG